MKKIVFSFFAVILFCNSGYSQNIGEYQYTMNLSGVWEAIIILGIILLALIGWTAYYVITNDKQKSQNRKKSHNHHAMTEETLENIKQRLTALEQEINSLRYTKPLSEPDYKPYLEFQQSITQPIHPSVQKFVTVKYPKAIIQNGFRDDLSETQGDNYFRFFNIKGNSANFDFCGTDFEKAKANKDTLEIVCEISGTSITAFTIENEKPGLVQFKDGKWEIIEKARIKFV